ncbi:hypothetical protein EX30DRAFT_60052 [Ascodesmis nigricans]|uniref:Uncharacterized protein n=1 Tax=Ascodesmis nigricans TaxID=341454 RepID=A0A4S2MV82_9PEZI|nr:hypothetical protein EX30DRAFT_60052 [Ascodesmis nigricans]
MSSWLFCFVFRLANAAKVFPASPSLLMSYHIPQFRLHQLVRHSSLISSLVMFVVYGSGVSFFLLDCVWIIFSFGFLSVCTPPVSSSTADPILVLLLFFYYFMRPFDKDGLASYSLSA